MQLDIDIRKTMRADKQTFLLATRFRSTSQRIVILGPSGAGKSLMLKTVAGLLTPDAGHIRLGATTLFDSASKVNVAPQRRHVAYLFQDYALFPQLNVRQNVGFGLAQGWRNPRRDVQHKAIDYWLDAFELRSAAQLFPNELSGGQRQRTALARALVSQPQALLLDEPFAALDPALRATMRHELDDLQRRLRVPIVLITHDAEDARLFGEHVLRMRDGAIVDDGMEPREAAR
ncbi:MAG TPA: ATP-binding cassette domain-containing protein [Telluria sp.]|nr:ATP-binding cassette domain-containing protein [Telluria sp.]